MLVSENAVIMAQCLMNGVLDHFHEVLKLGNTHFTLEALFGLSNIACDDSQAIE